MTNPVTIDQNALYKRYIKSTPLSRADDGQLERLKSSNEIDKLTQHYATLGYGKSFAEGMAAQIVPKLALHRTKCNQCNKGMKKCRFNDNKCELNQVNSGDTNDLVWSLYDRVVVTLNADEYNKEQLRTFCKKYNKTSVLHSGSQLVLLLKGDINPQQEIDFIADVKLLGE